MGGFHLIFIWSLSVSTASGRPGRPGTSVMQFFFHKWVYTYSCQFVNQYNILFVKLLLNYKQFLKSLYFLWFHFQLSQIIRLNIAVYVLALLICTGALILNPVQDISHLDRDFLWSYSVSPEKCWDSIVKWQKTLPSLPFPTNCS
jgi:hypothetical protein